MRRTKIICTLGPASINESVLTEMFAAGMNVGRLNFSHGTHEEHRETIKLFRTVRDKLKLPAAVLLDTKGPEIRLGYVKDGTVLRDGQLVGQYEIKDLPRVQLVSKMLGKELDDMSDIKSEGGTYDRKEGETPVFESKNLSSTEAVYPFDFYINKFTNS